MQAYLRALGLCQGHGDVNANRVEAYPFRDEDGEPFNKLN